MMLINWNRFIINLLPIALRTTSAYGFIRALFAPVVDLYSSFQTYERDVKYKLAHNSQAWSIQAVLNDAFDPDYRRIRIEDPGDKNVTLLNLDDDQRPLITDDDATAASIVHNDSTYSVWSWDFIVVIPYAYSDSEIYRLRALVEFYKLAGKRYDVIVG